MKKHLSTVILIIILIVGLCIFAYPTFSNWWNTGEQIKIVKRYEQAVSEMTAEDYTAYFEAAEDYNKRLREFGSGITLYTPDVVEGYYDTLDISGTGIIGYVDIEKIYIELPIYHGTGEDALQAGAGHLQGSSLPIGGEGTHSVISSHRGLPGSMLFTELDKLEIGDTFTITVLDRVYTYEVDQISIVLPSEYEELYIEDGQDYCTLMTCTPYGINTHRLLVRGVRSGGVGSNKVIRVSSQAYRVDTVIVASVVAIPILFILIIWLIINTGKKK